MLRALLTVGAIAALAAPAYAEEYFIVHGRDLQCRVVNHIPEDHMIVQVGPLGFRTRAEAERAIGTVCQAGYFRGQVVRQAGGQAP